MSRVFITGSSDGLGLLAAKLLIEQGHSVVLHGRNPSRSGDALVAASGAERAITGDLSTVARAKTAADEANKLGPFDAIIHNAGIGYRQTQRVETEPGVPDIFAVNVLAPLYPDRADREAQAPDLRQLGDAPGRSTGDG